MGFNNIYVRQFLATDLLDEGKTAVTWDTVEFSQTTKTGRSGVATFKVHTPTTIYGLALWWTARLADNIVIATGPNDPKTHWEQLYLPVIDPIDLPAGGSLSIRLKSTTSYKKGTNVIWTVIAHDAAGMELSQQSLDLDKGFVA